MKLSHQVVHHILSFLILHEYNFVYEMWKQIWNWAVRHLNTVVHSRNNNSHDRVQTAASVTENKRTKRNRYCDDNVNSGVDWMTVKPENFWWSGHCRTCSVCVQFIPTSKNDGLWFLSVESLRSDCDGRTMLKSKTAFHCSKIITAVRVG
jgi:hypothetical protein